MIPRYTLPEMAELWSPRTRFELWLEVEILALEAWAELGVIPAGVAREVREKARIEEERIAQIEREVHHDLIAFLRSVQEQLGEEAARYLHFGLTSNDVVDTAQGVLLGQAADLLIREAEGLGEAIARRAREHRDTPMVGRTHGVHAEPITFGWKLAVWYREMGRNLDRLRRAREVVRVGKISGAVGTYAHLHPRVEEYVLSRLGLEPEIPATQVVQRDRHAEFLCLLAVVGGSLEKFAQEIRLLQRTEVREAEEPFGAGQRGSSAMPHKKNPEKCERVCGLGRLLRGYALAALESQALWHERDISHSSVERVALADATTLLHYALRLMTEIVEGMRVHPDRMRENLNLTGGLIYSQRLLLALVERGMTREEAYRLVQRMALEVWEEGGSLLEKAREEEAVRRLIPPGELEALFSPDFYLRWREEVFRRAGLG